MAQNCGKERDDEYLSIPAKPPPRRGKILPVKVLRPKQPGGYDCEFVENPPSAIQTECSICLQILHVPKIIDCCGHNFCGACIDRIVKDGKFCPLCNEKKYSLMRNKGLERALNEFDVKCSYFKEGCRWTGKLGDFVFHLNSSGSSSECGFVEEICRHGCGDYFERRFLQQHQDKECPKRPLICDYCRAFISTFEDVTFNHYPVCGSYPIRCPNKCDFPFAIKRRDLPNHVDNDCPLTEVKCDFSFAGCKVKLPRKDMPDHLKENVTHLSLMAAKLIEKDKQIVTLTSEVLQRQDNFEKQLFTLKEENERLRHENAEFQESAEVKMLKKNVVTVFKKQSEHAAMNVALKQEVAMLRGENETLRVLQSRSEKTIQSMTDRLQHNVKTFRGELTASVDALRNELDKKSMQVSKLTASVGSHPFMDVQRRKLDGKIDSLWSHSGLLPCSLVMTDFSIKGNETWYSNPFYSYPRGYKMCLKVHANGVRLAKGSHVSVYVLLMRGEFDDQLKWPFRGIVTVQLQNQRGYGDEYEQEFSLPKVDPDLCSKRVTGGERGNGWGIAKFIALDQLEPNYLLNDRLHFVIPKVTCTSV